MMDDGDGSQALMARITTDPDLCGGRPCLRGMRIRVSDVVEMLASGESFATVLTAFPYLEENDLRAALLYAARAVDHRVIRAA